MSNCLSMSLTSELSVCQILIPQEEAIDKSDFMEIKSEQCAPPKQESILKNLIVNEEVIVDTNGHLHDKTNHPIDSAIYFEENLENCDNMTSELKESIDTIPIVQDTSIEEWDSENVEATTLKKSESEEQEDDEETIATFVTAAGQQLALYAVEDSDEIFAVAVYDESDEPPSNFQFLMKADVERLIGEGAVRTVKKPSQMKKRVFTAQPPIFYRKEEFEVNDRTYDISINDKRNENIIYKENQIEHNYGIYQNYSDFKLNSKFSDDIHTTTDEQPDITYLMMDDNFVNIAEQSDKCQDNLDTEDELMEHSTVQYIFLEADHQSDSELTFDEIQATLENMKSSRQKLLETSKKSDDQSSSQEHHAFLIKDSKDKEKTSSNEDRCEFESYISTQSTIDQALEIDKNSLVDTLIDLPSSTSPAIPQTSLKVKRSRKQQLISVDRDDGEIIIQPASMLNEELTSKKRTSRRRQLSSQMRVMGNNRFKRTKRIKRTKRRKIVEVIDLDVDEEEQTTRSVVEITLDDNKDKYSSDKENEIIMVRDSDSNDSDDEADEEDENNKWQSNGHLTKLNGARCCEYCSRNFRYRRTLNMHLSVCQKSPTRALNLDKRKSKSKESQKVKKQFTCKICQEKFDVVVALARHARAMHSQRKKHKLDLSPANSSNKSLKSAQRKETSSEEEELINRSTRKKELSMLARVKRRRKQKSNYSLEKKLNCADCGRWFPSTTLLNAHSLQHGTKKTEQLRKCHICKKLIRSRLLFLRHLKMHNDTQRNSDSSSRILRRKLRVRPGTRKIASPRKRGRPRKF